MPPIQETDSRVIVHKKFSDKPPVAITRDEESKQSEDLFRKLYMCEKTTPSFGMFYGPPITQTAYGNWGPQNFVPIPNGRTIEWVNQTLNERQKCAVTRILEGRSRPIPYIIFGPPGTGKTTTLVEAILQVSTMIPASRILVATPSNASADLITQRLLGSGKLTPRTLTRLMAIQRDLDTVPDDVKVVSKTSEELIDAVRRKICVTTCSTAGQIYQASVKEGHFTHVFIDEAGQATEPECLVPFCQAKCSKDTQLVLAGDPMQLGPVLTSRYALAFGLDVSLLERLCQRPCYRRNEVKFKQFGCYDPLLVTKLIDNYRSHPTLLSIYSEAFYQNELIACGENLDIYSNLPFLPVRGVPLVFHGVSGIDAQEENSPSYYNEAEITRVYLYVQDLLDSGVRPEEIGIISPYRKQVEKLRQFLSNQETPTPKIGSTEEFQGREFPVVILSTVRSDRLKVDSDRAHSIGFLDNPKRFNVAISRAKNLLIIVGDPDILRCDVHWARLFATAVRLGSYLGEPIDHIDPEER